MPAIMIAMMNTNDTSWLPDYVANVPAIFRKYGGEYVAAGQEFEVLEGSLAVNSGAVFRFPDMASLKAFLDCEEYRPYAEIRKKHSVGNVIAFESPDFG